MFGYDGIWELIIEYHPWDLDRKEKEYFENFLIKIIKEKRKNREAWKINTLIL